MACRVHAAENCGSGFRPNPVGRLARDIVSTEFDYITGTEATGLLTNTSGWLGSNVGQLNIKINTRFSSGNLCALPESGAQASGWIWQAEEQAIYKQIFLEDYYQKEARKILRNTLNTTTSSSSSSSDFTMTDWTTLREGDTQIVRQAIVVSAAQKNESAKIVRGFAEMAGEELKRLVHQYNLYNSFPRQVAGNDGEPA